MSQFNGIFGGINEVIKEPVNYTNAVVLENFSDLKKFTNPYGISSIVSSDYKIYGSSSIKVTSNGESTALRNNNVSFNLSKYNIMKLVIYVENTVTIKNLELYISNDVSYESYASMVFWNYQFQNGWNEVFINLNDFSNSGLFDINKLIKSFQIRLQSNENTISNIYLDSILISESKKKANVIFTFDDGFISQYTNAFPILLESGFVGNIGLVKELIGVKGYMSEKQAKEMYDYGWDAFNHTETHRDLSTLLKNDIKKEIINNKIWLDSLGMNRASNIVAYPYGGYNQDVMNVMNNNNIRLARSIGESDFEINCEFNKYHTRIRNMINSHPVSTFTSSLDSALLTGGTVIYLNHKIESTGTEDSIYSIEKFREIVNYVYSKRDKVNVITLSQWADEINT